MVNPPSSRKAARTITAPNRITSTELTF